MTVPAELPPETSPRLVLASGSPQRRLLLSAAGFDFRVVPPHVVEQRADGETPEAMVRRLAAAKAESIVAGVGPEVCIVGCDTTVVLDDEVLGKPGSEDGAAEMLLRLARRTHEVISGFAVIPPGSAAPEIGTAHTRVKMRAVSRGEAAAYAATGEPLDKAGAYGLQGEGARFVSGIEGSRSNVIGLPLEAIVPILLRHGIPRRPVHPVEP